MIVSVAYPEPSPDGGAQLVRDWDPTAPIKGDIVLVHGLNDHSGRFARPGSLLAEAGFRVRGFDLLGFGASSGERSDIGRWTLFLDQVQVNL
ncbi:MAG: alpha/beta hydrolase, partial [Acidimicrobiia bacterium]